MLDTVKGPGEGLKLGVKDVSGDWLLFVNSADYLLEDKLVSQIQYYHTDNSMVKLEQTRAVDLSYRVACRVPDDFMKLVLTIIRRTY